MRHSSSVPPSFASRAPALLVLSALCLLYLGTRRPLASPTSGVSAPPPELASAASSAGLVPSVLGGQHVLVSAPPLTVPTARGVALLLHGCSNSAETWRDGPIEREFVARLHARGIAVAALSSASAQEGAGASQCWDAEGYGGTNADLQSAAAVVCALRASLPPALPLALVGASSGGAFAALLASRMPPGTFSALLTYIMPLHPLLMAAAGLQAADDNGALAADATPLLACADGALASPAAAARSGGATARSAAALPAVLFVHMRRDAQTAAIVAAQRSALAARCIGEAAGGGAAPCVAERAVLPTALCADALAAWMPGRLTAQAGRAIVAALLRANVLSEAAALAAEPGEPASVSAACAASLPRLAVAMQPRLPLVRAILSAAVAELVVVAPGGKTRSGDGHLLRADDVLFDVAAPAAAPAPAAESAELADARRTVVRWLQELLNAAFAQHEMTAAYADDAASFILAQ